MSRASDAHSVNEQVAADTYYVDRIPLRTQY